VETSYAPQSLLVLPQTSGTLTCRRVALKASRTLCLLMTMGCGHMGVGSHAMCQRA
jgi:hypothetical protein